MEENNNVSKTDILETQQVLSTQSPLIPPKKSNKKMLLIASILLLVVLSMIGYFLRHKKTIPATTATATVTTAATPAPTKPASTNAKDRFYYSINNTIYEKLINESTTHALLKIEKPKVEVLAIKKSGNSIATIYKVDNYDEAKKTQNSTLFYRDEKGQDKIIKEFTLQPGFKTVGNSIISQIAVNKMADKIAYLVTNDGNGEPAMALEVIDITGTRILSLDLNIKDVIGNQIGAANPIGFSDDSSAVYLQDLACLQCDGPAFARLYSVSIKDKRITTVLDKQNVFGSYTNGTVELLDDNSFVVAYSNAHVMGATYDDAKDDKSAIAVFVNGKEKTIFETNSLDEYSAYIAGTDYFGAKTFFYKINKLVKEKVGENYANEEAVAIMRYDTDSSVAQKVKIDPKNYYHIYGLTNDYAITAEYSYQDTKTVLLVNQVKLSDGTKMELYKNSTNDIASFTMLKL